MKHRCQGGAGGVLSRKWQRVLTSGQAHSCYGGRADLHYYMGKMHSSDTSNVQYITYNTSETTCCLHRCTHHVYPANEVARMYITESFTTDFAFSSTADDDLGLILDLSKSQ